MTDKISNICESVLRKKPLIHCITNPISINECANTILSVGAKPIMAEHPEEVLQITAASDALMLNIGNITDARIKSIMLSVVKAKEKNIPVLLDVVGIACSDLRRNFINKLLKISVPSLIKGNYSEVLALYDLNYYSLGVDADTTLDVELITKKVIHLAQKYQTVILATGKIDIITDGKRTFYVKNGTEYLTHITGTGCMLGALCSAFMAVSYPIDAALTSCCYFGICGELSQAEKGNASYMINLIDNLSTLTKKDFSKYIDVEEI